MRVQGLNRVELWMSSVEWAGVCVGVWLRGWACVGVCAGGWRCRGWVEGYIV